MQLVLSGNRIIAHGDNFISMGGTVINTETNKRYENATVVECDCCPTDIDSVGYEYHAGRFVPCAPYGPGDNNGYFMEVCPDCATPRRSDIPVRWFKWESLAEATNTFIALDKRCSVQFPIDDLSDYAEIRVILKSGYVDNDSDESSTVIIYSENIDVEVFRDTVPGHTKKEYANSDVIYILRKEKYDTIRDYTGRVVIARDEYFPTISMTFELQGRKE